MNLSHLNIIDLSTVLAGPSVATFFAELGAHVTKIENTSNKDITRTWKTEKEDKQAKVSAYFSSVNYKKKYLSLNLRNSIDYQKFEELLSKADILITNFKKTSEKKLNLIPEEIQKKFPKLIHGRITGFGNESDRIAYDLIIQAETGLMSINGHKDGMPTKLPIAFVDILAAHQLKEGILLALLDKEKNKSGRVISVSLYDAAICSLANQASNFLMLNQIPERMGSLHPNIAPYGEIFTCKDGVKITFAIGSDIHFKALCDFLFLENVNNGQYENNQKRVKNRTQLQEIIQEQVKKLNSHIILEGLKKLHVPVAEIKNIKQVFEQDQAKDLVRKELIENEMTYRVSSVAFKYE